MIVVRIFANSIHAVIGHLRVLLQALHQVVVGDPHILESRVNQRGRLAKVNLHTIILEDTRQRFAKEGFERYPYPLSLSQGNVP